MRPRLVLPEGDLRLSAVAGVSFRQDAFGQPRVGPSEFSLRCEPENQHDRSAIAVYLRDRQIGYVSAMRCEELHPIIEELEVDHVVVVPGEIDRWDGGFGAKLALHPPGVLRQWLSLGPPRPVRIAYLEVRLKRLGDYQTELRTVLGPERDIQCLADVRSMATPSGKYQGQPTLVFAIDGVDIGLLPAQYRDEAPALFRAVTPGQPAQVLIRIARFDETVTAWWESVAFE